MPVVPEREGPWASGCDGLPAGGGVVGWILGGAITFGNTRSGGDWDEGSGASVTLSATMFSRQHMSQ